MQYFIGSYSTPSITMVDHLALTRFGPLKDLEWSTMAPINVILGKNGVGKTFILKALYSALRTLEDYGRGNDPRSAAELLAEKLYWTFQPDKIGDLVSKGAEGPLSLALTLNGKRFRYGFGKDTTRHISSIENEVPEQTSRCIFLPAKEVLSLHAIILKSREQDLSFGFDDTYLDLARALRLPPTKGKNYTGFSDSRKGLEDLLGGRVEFDEPSGNWVFRRGSQRFPIGVTAEGVKKIAILDTLLGNRYLDKNSIIFIDEPESALHPVAISRLLDIVALLSREGMQFFLATHSYFVVKKLYLIAQKGDVPVSVLSAEGAQWVSHGLAEGMPDNEIINASVDLYKEEIELTLR